MSRPSSKIDRKRSAVCEPSEPSTATRMRLTRRSRPRTIATGQGAYRATASDVLPTNNHLRGPRPRAPSAIMSTRVSSATWTISTCGSPCVTTVSTAVHLRLRSFAALSPAR